MEKTVPLLILSRRIKYLRISLIKGVKNLCIVNYTILMKEIKDTGKYKDIPYS